MMSSNYCMMQSTKTLSKTVLFLLYTIIHVSVIGKAMALIELPLLGRALGKTFAGAFSS